MVLFNIVPNRPVTKNNMLYNTSIRNTYTVSKIPFWLKIKYIIHFYLLLQTYCRIISCKHENNKLMIHRKIRNNYD